VQQALQDVPNVIDSQSDVYEEVAGEFETFTRGCACPALPAGLRAIGGGLLEPWGRFRCLVWTSTNLLPCLSGVSIMAGKSQWRLKN
jgi:hypothetical protein